MAVTKKLLQEVPISSFVVTDVNIVEDLSQYLPLSGGTMLGNFTISAANFMQTNGGLVYDFSGKNSFIQAEEAWNGTHTSSYGIACTGAKGFPILSIDAAEKRLKLSGDISELSRGMLSSFSYSFAEGCGTSCMTLLSYEQDESLSAGWAIFDTLGGLEAFASYSEESCIWRYYNDDNGLYCPKDPTIGNVIIANFYGNHAEGGSVKAIGKYSHAEGRATTADIRYSHAEGSFSFAGGMAAHAEGINTIALGQAAHAEGEQTIANGKYSHAAGQKARALANNQFVWSNGTAYGADLSSKSGTFCINPTGGLSGFYIGEKSILQHMYDFGVATIKNDIESSLSACFANKTDPQEIDTISIIKALSSIYLKVKS